MLVRIPVMRTQILMQKPLWVLIARIASSNSGHKPWLLARTPVMRTWMFPHLDRRAETYAGLDCLHRLKLKNKT